MDEMIVGTSEAKNRLSELLDEVAKGTEVVITRRGTPVARLIPAATDFDRARRAACGLRELSRGLSLEGLKRRRGQGYGQAVSARKLGPRVSERVLQEPIMCISRYLI